LPSSQFNAVLPQTPPAQVSLVVHAFPSLQVAELLAWKQPVAGAQKSSVQPLLSLQLSGEPPTQAPPEQVSFVVQAFPSSHEALLFTVWQPWIGSQVSSVQTLPSLQTGGGPPTHAPLEQVSFVVQALPSLQEETLFTFVHPVAVLHESLVQTFPSSQLGGGPPTQDPSEHMSPVVHAFPSSHGLALLVFVQPIAESQASIVQMLPSSQFGGAPPTHEPPEQTSSVVQAFPSLHATVLLVNTQTPPWHESSVQTLLSLHWLAWLHSMQPPIGVPAQTPPAQTSPLVQA
jgi:hypothetical protein